MNNRLVDLQTMLSSRATHFWVLVILAAVATILALAWPATLQAQSESNVTLSSLSVSGVDGTAIDLGTFDPTDTTYSATVVSTVARVTVEATPAHTSIFIMAKVLNSRSPTKGRHPEWGAHPLVELTCPARGSTTANREPSCWNRRPGLQSP